MKLAVNDETATHYGAVPESDEFTIKTTAKAFEVLSSKLYKNKIEAIVRELSCNAYDSHVMAGKTETPFDVSLPTIFSPHFIIRDYGTGLTDHEVRKVFTKFFESTKEDSNAVIGALGLGCKSPFSYVESFTVTAYLEGSRRVYECYKERGIPRITLRSEMPSNEDNGIEISVPVITDDNGRFEAAAQRVYRWFNVRPTMIGKSLVIENPPKFSGCWAQSNGGIEAIMGQVRYPVDASIVEASGLNNVAIQFDIGELDVQAGREELSYDPLTIANINTRIKDVIAEVDAHYAHLFDGCKNLYEASLRRNELAKDGKILICRPPMFRGVQVTHNAMSDFLTKHSSHRPVAFSSITDRGLAPNDDKTPRAESDPDNFVVFVFTRTDGKEQNRFNIWRRENPDKFGYQISNMHTDSDHFIDSMKDINWETSQGIVLQKVLAKVRRFSGSDIRAQHEVSVDLNESRHYVMSRNLYWLNMTHEHGNALDSASSASIFSLARELLPAETEEAVFFPYSRKKALPDDWVNIYDLLHQKYAEISKTPEYRKGIAMAVAGKEFRINSQWTGAAAAVSKQLPDNLKLTRFFKRLDTYLTARSDYHRWITYEEAMGIKRKTKVDLNKEWKEMKENFPLVFETMRPYNERSDYLERNIAYRELGIYAQAKEEKGLKQ